MQQEKQQAYRSTMMVLENIGVAKLGEKQQPSKPFEGKAIAKVVRASGDVDHVVVKWDDIHERPYVVFDPNGGRGMINEYVFIYTYDWGAINKADKKIGDISKKLGIKPVSNMDLVEVNLELLYVHGLTENELNEYKTIYARRALLAQKRDLYEAEEEL